MGSIVVQVDSAMRRASGGGSALDVSASGEGVGLIPVRAF
jgi:hypothetical protein